MKATATVTSKGQITIPQVVRRLLGLHAGDSVEFEVEKGRAEVRPARPRRVSSGVLNAHLPKGWKPASMEQMNKGMEKQLAERFRGK